MYEIEFKIKDGVLKKVELACLSTSAVIPEGVTHIGYRAFYLCHTLTSIIIPGSVTSIGAYAFNCCSALTSIKIPESVTSIEEGTFDGCESLVSLTIPYSVTNIKSYAFASCKNLTSITIQGNVKRIPESVFSYSTSLKSVTILNPNTNFNNNAFENTSKFTMHAPSGSYAEGYARRHNFPFVAISDTTPVEKIATKNKNPESVKSSKKSKFNKALKVRLDQCLEMYKRLAGFCEDKEENEAIDYLQGYFLLLCFALSNGSTRVNQKKFDCLEFYIQVSLDETSYPDTMRRMNCTKEKIKQFLDTPPEPLALCIIADNTMTSSPIDTTMSEFFIRIIEDFAAELANCNDSSNIDEITASQNYIKMLRDFVDKCSKMDNVFELIGIGNYLNLINKLGLQ